MCIKEAQFNTHTHAVYLYIKTVSVHFSKGMPLQPLCGWCGLTHSGLCDCITEDKEDIRVSKVV